VTDRAEFSSNFTRDIRSVLSLDTPRDHSNVLNLLRLFLYVTITSSVGLVKRSSYKLNHFFIYMNALTL